MTVKEFIKKWNINENEMRIYVTSLEDEVWRADEMEDYMYSEVLNAYEHNGDTVLQVA